MVRRREGLTTYEIAQVIAIRNWKNEEPGILSRAVGKVSAPLTWIVHKAIPEKAIQTALGVASWAGNQLADTGDIIRDGGVTDINELRAKSLELSDKLADGVHSWAIGIATVEGGVAGAAGLPGIAADVPAIVTLALRTVHKVGLCYGYECNSDADHDFVLGVLAASGANSMTEKIDALLSLQTLQQTLLKQTWKSMAKKAAAQRMSKEGGIIAIKKVAKQLGINLTKRKAIQAIPIVGAGVGASMNALYIKDVGWAARRAFQERWLLGNNKVLEVQ